MRKVNAPELPATTDKEFWGDAVHDTVRVDTKPQAPTHLTGKRIGGMFVVDGLNAAIAVDWNKYKIDDGRLVPL